MRYSGIGLGLCASVVWLTTALADSEKQETAQPAAQDATETVTVTAIRPKVQILPDRTVYSLDQDIQKSTGSLEDVMKNLPLVEVDPQGGVTLRSERVTILVDGNSSALFNHNQSDALKQLPASVVERIEVITNPSAEFKAEGTGGIINIVMKRDRDEPASGIVRVNVGSEGRANASINGNVTLDSVKLNGTYGERREAGKATETIQRSNGTTVTSSQDIASKTNTSSRFGTLSASIEIDSQNRIDIAGSYFFFGNRTTSLERAISDADATDITRDGLAHLSFDGGQSSLDYHHDFSTKGEMFDLHVSHSGDWALQNNTYNNIVTATGEADYWQSRRSAKGERQSELTARYSLPLQKNGELNIGYELESVSTRFNNTGFWRDTATDWSVDDDYTTLFDYDRTTHSGYVTYRQKFGDFGIKGGIRLEQDYLTTDLKTTGEVHHASTLGIFPSLYLTYSLTDAHQFGLSYSRRTDRPGAYSLSPAQRSNDAFNVTAGNPQLKAEMINSFEANYHYLGDRTDIVLTGYYLSTNNGITEVYRYISDTVLLTTSDNLARRMTSGMSADIRIDILSSLSLSTSGYFSYKEFDPKNGSTIERQSGINWSTSGGIDWHITPDDQLQFKLFYRGKYVSMQSSSNPYFSGSFGFKHSFSDKFSAVLTVNNLFASENYNRVLETSAVYQESRYHSLGRTFFFGLVYAFGGAKDNTGLSVETGSGGPPN